ncbi:hypothetical protein COX08_02640 [Candidatus Beckwithbacteria bacterium CG23_combo_of_CG06-09_8_20_14_all_34_8]|uniref:Uncharacterized protein n=1 Tax=Candidatus Beckwithbacteria bacterium CG23_combo_of_CG06-09_8_20_14_all_34_8 TaxID=1974497 RepID=A0A2H0B625_9BACT|nr:MAG: hypothetical protein COX08_02640 [Candidatus Beckwithbacteria bacterium CG23_combo_of_CG06-09_8_20_14_all_34_8]
MPERPKFSLVPTNDKPRKYRQEPIPGYTEYPPTTEGALQTRIELLTKNSEHPIEIGTLTWDALADRVLDMKSGIDPGLDGWFKVQLDPDDNGERWGLVRIDRAKILEHHQHQRNLGEYHPYKGFIALCTSTTRGQKE